MLEKLKPKIKKELYRIRKEMSKEDELKSNRDFLKSQSQVYSLSTKKTVQFRPNILTKITPRNIKD